MLLSTTPTIEGHPVSQYLGVVSGEAVAGINAIKDMGAGLRNVFGGRSQGYEQELVNARESSLAEMAQRAEALGAHAVVGIQFDYSSLGSTGSMLLVAVSGTAVIL